MATTALRPSIFMRIRRNDAGSAFVSGMPAYGVRRDKAALFQWVKAPPGELAPAGSNRSSHGGNEMAEAFG